MSLRDRLLARFARIVDAAGGPESMFGSHLLKVLDASDLSPLADRMAEEIQFHVDALVGPKYRDAVIDRPFVAMHWPILSGFTEVTTSATDENGRPCTVIHKRGNTILVPSEEEQGPKATYISSSDWRANHPDGTSEPADEYLDRVFYSPENTGGSWRERLPDGGTTGDWIGVALHRLWIRSWDIEATPPGWPYWPSDVNAQEIASALERVDDKPTRALAKVLRDGKTQLVFRSLTKAVNDAVDASERAVVLDAFATWDLTRCAIIVSALKQVEADRRVPTVRMSARPHARAAFRMLAEGPPTVGGITNWVEGRTGLTPKGNFELVWEGRRHPYQLNLLNDEPLSAGLVKAIQAELQDDGVRDWLTFHVMAEEQGGTGDFRWSWREHRERAGYDRRVASKSTRNTDAEVAAACIARIGRFTRAEARLEQERGGRIFWVRIGDHGLLDVPAGIDGLTESGRLTTVAAIRINKGILAGARGRERAPYYALIHRDIIALPRIERTLGTLLAFDWRVARDNGGTVVRTARTLWDYARIQGGQWDKRKRWPEARRSLDRALGVLGERIDLDWHAEPAGAHGLDGPDARYIIEPPPWWRDRLLHGVSPVLGQNTAGVPRTGVELAEWRSEHGVSLRQAAAIVGVKSPETIRKAEAKPNATLPADWLPLLAKARHG